MSENRPTGTYAPQARRDASLPQAAPREAGALAPSRNRRRRPIKTRALWIVQGLLALIFLFAGGLKLVLSLENLTGPVPLPGRFVRFVGVAGVLGGIGLILPGLLRIRPGLTPLAAAGLVIIMTGATVITLAVGTASWVVSPVSAPAGRISTDPPLPVLPEPEDFNPGAGLPV